MAEYGGMSISDWNSAKETVKKHLGILCAKNPDQYHAVYEAILIHLIVDIFMSRERPDLMPSEALLEKYTKLFREGLGINLMSLESDNWEPND